jgi:hypothetical protein
MCSSNVLARWGMKTVFQMFFDPTWGKFCLFYPKREANRERKGRRGIWPTRQR